MAASVRPSFGRVPTPTIWFMNSVGLNIFIAIVGISAGPGFVNGLKTQGVGLFLWGALRDDPPDARDVHRQYLFRFHDALTLGIVSGRARRRHRSAWSAIRPRARCRRSATR